VAHLVPFMTRGSPFGYDPLTPDRAPFGSLRPGQTAPGHTIISGTVDRTGQARCQALA